MSYGMTTLQTTWASLAGDMEVPAGDRPAFQVRYPSGLEAKAIEAYLTKGTPEIQQPWRPWLDGLAAKLSVLVVSARNLPPGRDVASGVLGAVPEFLVADLAAAVLAATRLEPSDEKKSNSPPESAPGGSAAIAPAMPAATSTDASLP